MKIGFFTEAGYQGKVPRNHPNMRTDLAWVCALNATHHPILTLHTLSDNMYDVGIMIIPKKKQGYLEYDILNNFRRVCKKVTVMQESTYNWWQDSPLEEQIWYYNLIAEMDLMFCHNDIDLKYYSGITNKRAELLPSLMITDNIKRRTEIGKGVVIGGNFVWIYGGFDSYQVALEISEDVTAPTTGRMKPEETQILRHLPWIQWNEWIEILASFYAGVQMGTPAAGTFNLNCSFHGTPCVGYSNLNTQNILHPLTTVEMGDIEKAKELAKKLNDDKFYKLCSDTTLKRYESYYSDNVFIEHMTRILKTI